MLALLALAVLVPVVLAIVYRPQRGMLLLVALAPFDGLLLILPFPSFVKGWKEVLVGIILVATLLCPQEARASRGRQLPRWLPPLVVLIAIGLLSAAFVGGDQALLGLKVNFYYLLLGIAVWRCPPNERERDRLVTILMVTGLICSIVGLVQQAIGDARLHDLGYEYNTAIRFAGSNLRSFSTFNEPFPFALFVMTVLLVGVPCALDGPAPSAQSCLSHPHAGVPARHPFGVRAVGVARARRRTAVSRVQALPPAPRRPPDRAGDLPPRGYQRQHRVHSVALVEQPGRAHNKLVGKHRSDRGPPAGARDWHGGRSRRGHERRPDPNQRHRQTALPARQLLLQDRLRVRRDRPLDADLVPDRRIQEYDRDRTSARAGSIAPSPTVSPRWCSQRWQQVSSRRSSRSTPWTCSSGSSCPRSRRSARGRPRRSARRSPEVASDLSRRRRGTGRSRRSAYGRGRRG